MMQWGTDFFATENVSVQAFVVAPTTIVPLWSVEFASRDGEVPHEESTGVPPPKWTSPALSIMNSVVDATVDVVVEISKGLVPVVPLIESLADGDDEPIPISAVVSKFVPYIAFPILIM